MVATGYGFKVEGAAELLALLKQGDFMYKPVKRSLAKIGQAGKRAAQAAAPVGKTRQLRSKITYRVNTKKREPRFVAIATRAANARGYPYPRVLEFSGKHGHKGWMLAAITGIKGQVAASLAEAASQIEAEFGRGAR